MAGRRLSAEERALWARVTVGVRARGPVPATAVGEAQPAAPQRTLAAAQPSAGRTRAPLPQPRAVKSIPAAAANTLDGAWDRRLATGTIVTDMTIDLHGCGLDAAHRRLDAGLARAIGDGCRILLLITGRPPRAGTSRIDAPLRGIIRASVPDWLAASPHVGQIAAVRGAHPRHGGAGALYIVLRRIRK